jgi:amino acid efflux transporter
VQAAGPASIIAWALLLVLSAPLAVTFAALGTRYPVAGGVSEYARAGFGDVAAAVTGDWFVGAVVLGAPAVALIGGFYVADLTGSGTSLAVAAGVVMFAVVLVTNAFGLRLSSAFQLGLSTALVAVLAVAIAVALPTHGGDNWTPFAPHGWLAVGTAASILVWLFVGWEAVAQLAGEFRRPAKDLPRAIAVAFAVVTVLYISLAVATIGVTGHSQSRVPLADLIGVGFGHAGRVATAVLAVALTMGTMNVYIGGTAKLVKALAAAGALPAWFRVGERSVPLRPLLLFGVTGALLMGALAAGWLNATDLVRATSSLFVAVYVVTIISAVRVLKSPMRGYAIAAAVMVAIIAIFSGAYLVVPAFIAAFAISYWSFGRRRASSRGGDLMSRR